MRMSELIKVNHAGTFEDEGRTYEVQVMIVHDDAFDLLLEEGGAVTSEADQAFRRMDHDAWRIDDDPQYIGAYSLFTAVREVKA